MPTKIFATTFESLNEKWNALFLEQGSTRSLALLRICFVFLCWGRFAKQLTPFATVHNESILTNIFIFLFFGASLLMLVGWHAQWATAITGLSLTFLKHAFPEIPALHHHNSILLILAILILALSPVGASYSLDRWRKLSLAIKNHQPPPTEMGDIWVFKLLAILISSLYFWTAVNKLNGGFLSGDRLQAILMYFYWGPQFPPFFGFREGTFLISVGVTLFEFVLAFGLWVPRWRSSLMILGMIFHATTYLTMPVGGFFVLASMLYVAFIPPNNVHRMIDKLQGYH